MTVQLCRIRKNTGVFLLLNLGNGLQTGMRITVGDILGWLGGGMIVEDIIDDFPELTREDIQVARRFYC